MELRRTVGREISVDGIALHAGVPVVMRIAPAEADSGIQFRRNDLPGRPLVHASWRNIIDSRFATVVAVGGATVAVTEHLLAALSGAGLDDCLIELDGPEPPLLDGDALSFLQILDHAGVRELDVPRSAIRLKRAVEVKAAAASVRLLPSNCAEFFFEIDFPATAIGHQVFECILDETVFRSQIAPARTFGFLDQAEQLRSAGFARGATLDNTLVIDGGDICNPDRQRFPDEFVRHKILDAIGDMKLADAPLIARFEGRRSSHALNAALLRILFSDSANYEIVSA
jgi:UDP-3-O-[3-hydroxymyristoyl] N-acetylglucosamine deacetylase